VDFWETKGSIGGLLFRGSGPQRAGGGGMAWGVMIRAQNSTLGRDAANWFLQAGGCRITPRSCRGQCS